MENERTENIFYLDLKRIHKYGCAKFQPNPLFSSQQMATESAAEEKKKKKVGKPIGDPQWPLLTFNTDTHHRLCALLLSCVQ